MSSDDVPARTKALAAEVRSYLVQKVIDDMLEAGEDCTDTALYLRRLEAARAELKELL